METIGNPAVIAAARQVEVPGGSLHVREAGRGPVVLFVHGGGVGATGWNRSFRNVEAFAARHRVIVPDMPGFGRSDPGARADVRGPAAWVPALRALIEALGIDELAVVGNANGGVAAMWLALELGPRVRRLVLTAPLPGNERALLPKVTEGIGALDRLRADPTPDAMRAYLATLVHDPSLVDDALVEERLRWMPASQAGGLLADAPHPPPLAEELGRLATPTLVAFGHDDRHIPVEHGLAILGRLPDAELHVFTRCGHWVDFEQAARFNRVALDFIA